MVCRGVTLHDDLHDRGLTADDLHDRGLTADDLHDRGDATTAARLRPGIDGPMP
jgi:hypothetical protein